MFSAEFLHLPELLVQTWNSRLLWSWKEWERELLFAGRPLGPERSPAPSLPTAGWALAQPLAFLCSSTKTC